MLVVQNLYVRARSGQVGGQVGTPGPDRLLEVNLELVGVQRGGAG